MGSMIFLALIIVLVSGLIAYVGDLVGRKMGRKRLTLMGLRPRHTAIVISVGAGMLIAILTLIAVMAVNKGVREAFFTPLDQVKAELVRQRGEVARTTVELNDARRQARETGNQLSAQTGQLTKTNELLKVSTGQRKRVETELAHSQRQLALVHTRLRENAEQLAAKRRELEHARQEYARISNDLSASQSQLKSAHDSLMNVTEQIRKLENDKLALEDAMAWWDERVKVLSEFARSSFSPLSIAYGQEIVTGLIPDSSMQDQRSLVKQLLETAEDIVRHRSVDLPANASGILYFVGDKEQLTHISANEAVDTLLKRINVMEGSDGVIVRITPVNNVPLNGPAFVAVDKVDLIPNAPAFSAGSVVARLPMTMTSQTSRAEILGKLADNLLREALPAALRAKGMVSITRRFDPVHADVPPEASMPTVSWAELMNAVDKAKSMQGDVELVALSRDTVTCYGPVDIVLDVLPSQ